MGDYSVRRRRYKRPLRPALTLTELLALESQAPLGDYLSLSLSTAGNYTKITITTLDAESITYSAIVPENQQLDLDTLVFVAGSRPAS